MNKSSDENQMNMYQYFKKVREGIKREMEHVHSFCVVLVVA